MPKKIEKRINTPKRQKITSNMQNKTYIRLSMIDMEMYELTSPDYYIIILCTAHYGGSP